MSSPNGGGALGSVRELEQALDAKTRVAAEGETLVEAARAQAGALLAAARERAARENAARRRSLVAAADADVLRLSASAEAAAADLRARAREIEEAALEAGLALVLPPRREVTP